MTYTGSASEYWPPERIEHMQLLFTEGLSARQVGERLGVSHRAVLAKCSRLGVSVGHASEEWPEEKILRLRELAGKGYSSSDIGAMMSLTKNAVVGKARRSGIALTNNHYSYATGSRRKRPEPKINPLDGWRPAKNPRWEALSAAKAAGPPQATSLPADVPGRAEGGLGIFDLQPDSCRYPCAGDGVAIVYCGATSVDGCSWCERHLRVVYRPRAA